MCYPPTLENEIEILYNTVRKVPLSVILMPAFRLRLSGVRSEMTCRVNRFGGNDIVLPYSHRHVPPFSVVYVIQKMVYKITAPHL